MADEFEQSKSIKSAQHKSAEFQEAPGEAEADAAREAFLKNAGQQPAEIASSLSRVDSSLRARAISRLQAERGNRFIQRMAKGSSAEHGAPGRLVGLSQPEMVSEVQRRKSSGSELGGDARTNLENHFGADLSSVRIHTDGESAALNRELNAQAFTVGSDVFMAEGKFNPTSSEGQGLLAHELTHVGQQTGFGAQGVQREGQEEEEEVQREEAPEEEESTQL
jgi:hypothetical protein